MALRTALFTFKLLPEQTVNPKTVENALQKHFPTLKQTANVELGGGNLMTIFVTEDSTITFTLRYYATEKLFSLNGEAVQSSPQFTQFNNVYMEHVRETIDKLSTDLEKPTERLPIIKRDNSVPIYFLTSDNRVLEYDFDKVVVHEKSQFQDIKILHSPTLGNVLLLDDLQNLAEADINYTRGLMNFGKIDYKDKEILILGGGDGGLLHELLKENPKFVTMVDIDGSVMKYCQTHLKGACGTSLDSWKGDNYHVIEGDCIDYMQNCIKNGQSFDFVFNDLTDIPISTKDNKDLYLENSAEMWKFVRQILELALQLVRTNGKYLNHAIGIGCKSALKEYEHLLKSELTAKVEFSNHTAYVPSFLEEWVFYEIWKN